MGERPATLVLSDASNRVFQRLFSLIQIVFRTSKPAWAHRLTVAGSNRPGVGDAWFDMRRKT
jgi:hypothetical protein